MSFGPGWPGFAELSRLTILCNTHCIPNPYLIQKVVMSSCHTGHSPVSLKGSGERWNRPAWGKLQSGLYTLTTGCVLCSKDVSVGCFFLSLFWNSELLNSHLGCFSAVTLKAAGRKDASDLSPQRDLLSLQTWVWLRLRYRATRSGTVVMKLAELFDLSVGSHTPHTLRCSANQKGSEINAHWLNSYRSWKS